ncbi:hypothetical protein RBI14_09505 [Alcaligenaceae bacterium B3P038]|nr:hypothetical protein [Alcaligenaceae bacterium B3P038]
MNRSNVGVHHVQAWIVLKEKQVVLRRNIHERHPALAHWYSDSHHHSALSDLLILRVPRARNTG